MQTHGDYGGPDGCQFFFSELTETLTSEDLLQQAYILVSKLSFSYSDVKVMTKKERMTFLRFYSEEMKRLETRYDN